MKNTILLLIFTFLFSSVSFSQFDKRIIKIGLFVPLHLDKSFDSTGTDLIKPNEFPRQSISGLELYEGAYMAIDSLNKNGIRVLMKVFDTQSKSGNISTCVEKNEFEDIDIVFAHGSINEIQQLSIIANEYKLPFINLNLPNNTGILNSPYTYIANPTIETHLAFLQEKINQKWPDQNIIWVRRNSATDEIIEKTFDKQNSKSIQPLSKKTVEVDPLFKWIDIKDEIDTTKLNLLFIGSVDNSFSLNMINTFSTYPKKNLIQIIGMPNLELLREIQQPKYGSLPIFYSSPIFIPTNHVWAKGFGSFIKSTTYSNASLSAYKGFELIFYFTSIFSKYGKIEVYDKIDDGFKVLNDYQFKPTKSMNSPDKIDYFENKNLYFIRRLNGSATISF
jgi:hypothetical protein